MGELPWEKLENSKENSHEREYSKQKKSDGRMSMRTIPNREFPFEKLEKSKGKIPKGNSQWENCKGKFPKGDVR